MLLLYLSYGANAAERAARTQQHRDHAPRQRLQGSASSGQNKPSAHAPAAPAPPPSPSTRHCKALQQSSEFIRAYTRQTDNAIVQQRDTPQGLPHCPACWLRQQPRCGSGSAVRSTEQKTPGQLCIGSRQVTSAASSSSSAASASAAASSSCAAHTANRHL